MLKTFVKNLTAAIFLFAFFSVALVLQTQGAVTEDSRSSQGGYNNNLPVSSISWSHTLGIGSSRAVYVTVAATSVFTCPVPDPLCTPLPLPPGVSLRIQSATFNGVAMTNLGEAVVSTETSVAIFRLTAAEGLPSAPGAYNVTVNLTPGASAYAEGNSLSFFGVNQMTPNGTVFAASGNSDMPGVTVTGIAAGDTVLDILGSTPNGGSFADRSGQKVCSNVDDETTCTRGRRFFNDAFDIGASGTLENPLVASLVAGWEMTRVANWVMQATVIKAALTTAASVTVSGRVLTGKNRGVAGAVVYLTDSNGETRSARTNTFGFYRFDNVAAGQTATLEVRSKRFSFPPQAINVNADLSELNFIAQP